MGEPPAIRFSRTAPRLAVAALVCGVAACSVVHLCVGAPTWTPVDLIDGSFADTSPHADLVLWELRVPRLLLALISGLALGAVGTTLQEALGNGLAGPELTGVGQGCALVVATCLVFNIAGTQMVPLLAAAGGSAAGWLTSRYAHRGPLVSVLAGVAVNAFAGALVVFVISLGSTGTTQLILNYLAGSLLDRRWHHVVLAVPAVIVGCAICVWQLPGLRALSFGDASARSIGVRPDTIRRWALLGSALATAGVVSACGPIAFVALPAPHIARRLLGTGAVQQVMPVAAVIAAFLVVAADLLAKVLVHPAELPLGLVTTVLGAPLAIGLLRLRG